MPRTKKSLSQKGLEILIKKFNIKEIDFVFLGRISKLEEDPRIRLAKLADDTNFRDGWIYLKEEMTLLDMLDLLEKAGFPDYLYKTPDPLKITYLEDKIGYTLRFKHPNEN